MARQAAEMAADLPFKTPRRVTVQPDVAERAVTVGVVVATSTEVTQNTAAAVVAEVALVLAVKLEMVAVLYLVQAAEVAAVKVAPVP